MHLRACAFVLVGAALAACGSDSTAPARSAALAVAAAPAADPAAVLDAANIRLRAAGKAYRVGSMEYVTTAVGNHPAGQIVFAKDVGNKQFVAQWVPGDPRRGHDVLTYVVDQSGGEATAASGTLTNAQTEAAVDRAMHTWSSQTCTALRLQKVADPGTDIDIEDALLGVDDSDTPLDQVAPVADITEAGWYPGALFDELAPQGSTFILGVTFTFIWVDQNGAPTDINRDGKLDTALAESYYNNALPWGINAGALPADVETVVLHETGHALSQNHFGKIFATFANLELHFAPFALMNAAVSRLQQTPTGSDNAGHCSIWASWPKS